MYYIWNKVTAGIAPASCGCCNRFFDTEDEAHAFASQNILNSYRVHKWNDEIWAVLARDNLRDNLITSPVWSDQSWARERAEVICTFAHVDPDNSSYIRFYANEKDGARERWSSTTPGRYLTKFHADTLDPKEIKAWAEKHKEQFVAVKDDILQWASSPQEIESVYSMPASFFSCMQAKAGDKWNDIIGHPTSVYGAGDLKVAYIAKGGKLISRALVWPEKKKVGRVYGNDTLLRTALAQTGIETKSNIDTYDTMEGARLIYKPIPRIDRYSGHPQATQPKYPDVVLPYIDGSTQRVNLASDGFLRIEPRNDDFASQYLGNWEGGIAKSKAKCGDCAKWQDSIEANYNSPYLKEKHLLGLSAEEYESLCVACRKKYIYTCSVSGYHYPISSPSECLYGDPNLRFNLQENVGRVFKSALSSKWYENRNRHILIGGRAISTLEFLTKASELTYVGAEGRYALASDVVRFRNGRINIAATSRRASFPVGSQPVEPIIDEAA